MTNSKYRFGVWHPCYAFSHQIQASWRLLMPHRRHYEKYILTRWRH